MMRNRSTIFESSELKTSKISEPDIAIDNKKPNENFILCRNLKGESTAVYGENKWDFNPYRLSARKIKVFNFDGLFTDDNFETKELIKEMKYILYCLIYHTKNGKIGRLSASTSYNYFLALSRAIKFCYEMKGNSLVKKISLKDLLTNQAYMVALLDKHRDSDTFNSSITAIMNHCASFGSDVLGYKALPSKLFNIKLRSNNQHPVIPTRIYLSLIDSFTEWLDKIEPYQESISNLLREYKNPLFGVFITNQRLKGGGIRKNGGCLNTVEAIEQFNLSELFSNVFSVKSKQDLSNALTAIQYICKNIIHIYTGMRDQEVLRLTLNCITEKQIIPDSVTPESYSSTKGKVIKIISSTTKYTGYEQETSWLASNEVIRAVNILKSISLSLAHICSLDIDQKEIYLFLNPSILKSLKPDNGVGRFSSRKGRADSFNKAIPKIEIIRSDVEEMIAINQDNEFNEEKYSVGMFWPITSHQYRRSLAFFASSSGFVSLPSLKKQFKQLSIQMAQYYSNGFDNIKTIFGSYDPEKDAISIPSSHILYEFQVSSTYDVVHQILSEVAFSEEKLFGGSGSYIEKQRIKYKSDEITIKEIKSDTLSQVRNGEISYKETLLGGCTKSSRCDELILGDIASCLTCSDSIIKEDKLSEAIENIKLELNNYKKDSGEYMIVSLELKKLEDFYEKIKRK